jgi:hypothetical protein
MVCLQHQERGDGAPKKGEKGNGRDNHSKENNTVRELRVRAPENKADQDYRHHSRRIYHRSTSEGSSLGEEPGGAKLCNLSRRLRPVPAKGKIRATIGPKGGRKAPYTIKQKGRRSPAERGENSMKQITREDIIKANAYGLNHRDSLASYRTPVLMCALLWGQKGIDLSSAPTVSGWRYGENVTGISHNYREDVSEYGLSLAALDGETACGSEVWFAERDIVRCQGVLLPKKGSDGEPLVLPIGGEDLDN